MKEHQLRCTDDEVRAIQAGLRTQVRRPVKPQPEQTLRGGWRWGYPDRRRIPRGPRQAVGGSRVTLTELIGEYSPFGQPGDQLWVQECWATVPADIAPPEFTRPAPNGEIILYRSDWKYKACKPKWSPSTNMPRWASRITLEVQSMRVEQVQDITYDDAIAEGWPRHRELFPTINAGDKAQEWFRRTWGTIYGTWADNPLVWVATFRELKR